MNQEEITQAFNNWKTVHFFLYGETFKSWINETNYTNLFISDWNELMSVIDKVEGKGVKVIIGRMFCEISYTNPLEQSETFEIRIVSGIKKNAIYGALVRYIKWYNENNLPSTLIDFSKIKTEDQYHEFVRDWMQENNLPEESLDEIDSELFTTDKMKRERDLLIDFFHNTEF
tara:strand:- start:51 stop:569 length:519 start_codon:yes stop_codon:yes gene_type:complete